MNTKREPQAVAHVRPARDPQPIELFDKTFLYQLDAPLDEGGVNLWQGNLQSSNGHSVEYVIKAAKLFAAAEDLLQALQQALEALRCGDPNAVRNALRDCPAAIAKATT